MFAATPHFLLFTQQSSIFTHVLQFLIDSIMREGIHETQALEAFFLASKSKYTELSPADALDHAEADQAITELRRDLRL